MAEVILDRSRIVTGVGQGIAAGMAKHVDVNLETNRGLLAQALDMAI